MQVENLSDDETTSRLLRHTETLSCSPKHLSLSDDDREITAHIAGYIAKKVKKRLGNYCKEHFFENSVSENSDFSYLKILLRGGLTIPSINLVNYVCTTFAILNYSVDVINQINIPRRTAAERILCQP